MPVTVDFLRYDDSRSTCTRFVALHFLADEDGRRRFSAGDWQRLRHVQGRFRRRRCSSCRVPVDCRPSSPSGAISAHHWQVDLLLYTVCVKWPHRNEIECGFTTTVYIIGQFVADKIGPTYYNPAKSFCRRRVGPICRSDFVADKSASLNSASDFQQRSDKS